jgi:hypothetical protein
MSKDTGSFLRKVVRFVANPTTGWSELDAPLSDAGETDYAKTEIKAMIERKRRNDFVRKRELDMLRKIRREGLNPDQALLLGSTSNLDPESRPHGRARSDSAVKAKIDQIELQMVGQGMRPSSAPAQAGLMVTVPDGLETPVDQAALPLTFTPTLIEVPDVSAALVQAARSSAPRMPGQDAQATHSLADVHGVQVTELAYDAELDEAVIAFANADFDQCESYLLGLVHPGAARHNHMETWLVLFDLYRALDLPHKFDQFGVSFAQQFGVSAPQWYSMPRRVAEFLQRKGTSSLKTGMPAATAGGAAEPDHGAATQPDDAPLSLPGWIAPTVLDQDAIAQLRVALLQLSRPWRMDFSALHLLTAEGAHQLGVLLQSWAREPMVVTWAGTSRLLGLLEESTPTGDRDSDPAFWMLRLDVLRLINKAVTFDEVAIDYCVTYERSPPSWEPSACSVKQQDDAVSAHAGPLSHVSDVTTSFVESQIHSEVDFVQVASLDLSGQLVGDIGRTLEQLDDQLGASISLDIDCRHLLRVDFIAAGDLLNWVLARRAEERQVHFVNPHRLVALFFGAMGINEHATVKLQRG